MTGAHRLAVLLVLAALSGCSSAGTVSGRFIPRSPALLVSMNAGCPATDVGYRDVVNTFPGPPLVPPGTTGGLICRYGAGPHLGLNGAGTGTLASSRRLGEAQADELANAIRQVNLDAPFGSSGCPADVGLVTVIGLAYAGRADVGLWYKSSGCQTLDNGRIGAFEGGNPSFYNGFEGVINHLSPPPS